MFGGKDYKIDLLRQVPVFATSGKRSLNSIARMADVVEVKPGTILVSQGHKGLEFVLVVEGQAKVVRDGKIVNYLACGDFFGEIALLDGRASTASVIAETDMRLLAVHCKYFHGLLRESPQLHREIHFALCRYIRESTPSDRSRPGSEPVPEIPSVTARVVLM